MVGYRGRGLPAGWLGRAVVLGLLALACRVWAAMPAAARIEPMAGWRVMLTPDIAELADVFFLPDFDDTAWAEADIRTKEPPYTARYVLYRKWVGLPAGWRGKKVDITFSGVDDDAVVYVNGRKMGAHKGWDEPFTVDITPVARCGERNLIAVLADNSGGGGSGIWRPVEIALTEERARAEAAAEAALRKELGAIPYKIVFETYRDGSWELHATNADGSGSVDLTNTPDVHELYPHVSPDGSKVCFSADEGEGAARVRSVYYMNLDGTDRRLVGRNIRQACWSPDGGAIAYLKGEEERFVYRDYATKDIVVYDLASQEHRPHPNRAIHHLYNLCWSPDGKWFLATVHAGMGYKHGILAIEVNGTTVHNLGIGGCRPDISPVGGKVAWGVSDWALRVGDLNFSGDVPRVTNQRDIVTSRKPTKIYHVDWSPDGRYVAFSRGPSTKRLGHAPEIVGIRAVGWDLCIADATARDRWVQITADGQCNKEPDWVPNERRAK